MDQLIKAYTLKYDHKIRNICKPLVDILKIPYFTHFQIESDGTFSYLSNYAEQSDYYYSEKQYQTNPYLVHPSLLRSGTVLTETTPSPEYLENIKVSQQKFHLHNTFLMVDYQGDKVQGFFFGMEERDPLVVNRYLKYLESLKKFNRYFLQEAAPLLAKIKKEGYNLHEAKGDAFLERAPGLPLSREDEELKRFAQSITPLTERELECLELFRQGNSAQSTAAKLGLSPRTVEHHFESIKTKLNCASKWDLLNR